MVTIVILRLIATETWCHSFRSKLSKVLFALESTFREKFYYRSIMKLFKQFLWGLCSSNHSYYFATQVIYASSQLGF